jgi:hypothetical protein
MATSEKRKALVNKLLKKNGEPEINQLNYNASIIDALNHYNSDFDNKTKRKWFVEYFGKKINYAISEINDYEFRSVGTICRVLMNGNELSEEHKKFIETEFERLKKISEGIKAKRIKAEKAAQENPVVEINTKPTIQDRLEDIAVDFMSDLNGMVDDFIMDRSKPLNVAVLMRKPINGPVGKKILAKIKRTTEELQEVLLGQDKVLVEAYGNFKKAELKKLSSFYDELTEKLGQTKKVIRTQRKPKAKPPAVVVSRLKYMKESNQLNIKSVSATGIVGATEIWLYNTKNRRLQMYCSMPEMTLTVRGTSIMNFDPEKSVQKLVKKPEEISNLMEKGKRTFSSYLKLLQSRDTVVTGRMNDQTLILATFK